MEENKSPVGSIIATIIIIALIVLGSLYFWGKRLEEARNIKNLTAGSAEATTTPADAITNEANAIQSVSPSDDLNAIQSDLQNTNTTNLGAELNATSTQ